MDGSGPFPATYNSALDRDGAPVSPPPAAGVGPALVPFPLNFTITNLTYTPDMRHLGSAKFNSTEKALTRLVRACPSLL